MVVVGIDAHKRTHTVVAVDEAGRQLAMRVTKTTSTAAHLGLVRWAGQFGPARSWAVQDCRHLSRRLEADLLAGTAGLVTRLAADLTARITAVTTDINALEREIAVLTRRLAPSLLAVPGAAELTAAKIVSQTADVRRFTSTDAYARHNGTAPLPVWSANNTRHRLSRTGNRQLNCAIHRIAVTQIRCHPPARAYLKTRIAAGDSKTEALRALKRRLSDIVYRALLADGTTQPVSQAA